MTRLVSFPFALGFDEETAPRELPEGPLREAINVRQRRGSAFGVRAEYVPLSLTEFDGTLVPFDVYTLNGRLLALGDRQGTQRPTDIFEFVEQAGGAWKGTLPVGGDGHRIPAATKIRNVGQPPDGVADVHHARIAAVNGLVCLVYGFGGTSGGLTNYVHIFEAATDSTILVAPVLISNTHVVVAGDSFWILGVNLSSDLVGYRFDTLVDDDLRSVTTLYTGTVTTNIYDAATVNGSPPSQFAFIVRNGSTTVIRVINESGSQALSFSGPAVAADVLQIEADDVAEEINVAYRAGANDAVLTTYNLTSGALEEGPTDVFNQAVEGDLSLARPSLGSIFVDLSAEDSTGIVRRASVVTQTHTRNLSLVHNYQIGGRGTGSPLGTIQPMIVDDTNQLVLYDGLEQVNKFQVIAQQDLRIATDGTVGVAAAMGGETCFDATTGKHYWARLVEGTDGQQVPVVSEVVIGSTDKRQATQVGNELLVSGGVGLIYDGRQVTESGFLERPVFQSTTPGSIGGALLPGAEYDYVAVYKHTDSQGLLTQSAVSDIQTVTMGASDNGVTALIYAPHTLRRDLNSGSASTISLYRTFADVTETKATLLGRAGLDPPSASLTGLQLWVFISDSTSSQLFTVTFTSGATTSSAVAGQVNAVTTGRITATSLGGALQLESVEAGSNVSVWIYGGTAASILGFLVNEHDYGTTSFTKGTVFQLAASFPVPLSGAFGAPVTVLDFLSDTDLLTKEPLYTQGERGALSGILQHDPPPPFEFAWTVQNRAFIGGLPDRSEVRISKALFPAEAPAFSEGFAFRANVQGDVTAVAGLDGIPIAFTADDIFRLSSQLPNDNGEEGELGPAFRIPSEGGCSNAFSICETSLGLFYQAGSGKIMLLPRGGTAPIWIGRTVQDSLQAFPTITSAVYVDVDHVVTFTCQSAAGDASIILVFDLRVAQWYKDTFSSAQIIQAGTSYLGRLVYVDGPGGATNIIRQQSESLTPPQFITLNAKSGTVHPFGGNGWGQLVSITLSGEFRGDCQIRCRISYDDGTTFTNLKTFTLTSPTYTTGQTILCQWWPARRKCSDFVLDFQVLEAVGGSEGAILNLYTLEVEGSQPQRVRTRAADRG